MLTGMVLPATFPCAQTAAVRMAPAIRTERANVTPTGEASIVARAETAAVEEFVFADFAAVDRTFMGNFANMMSVQTAGFTTTQIRCWRYPCALAMVFAQHQAASAHLDTGGVIVLDQQYVREHHNAMETVIALVGLVAVLRCLC